MAWHGGDIYVRQRHVRRLTGLATGFLINSDPAGGLFTTTSEAEEQVGVRVHLDEC